MVEVSVALLVIHAVADHEHVRDLESAIGDGQIDQASGGLVEKGADFDAGRVALLERFQEVCAGQSCVDYVFNQQNISSFDAFVEVFGDFDDAGLSRVTGDGHEVDVCGNGDGAEQIGGEDERAAQHSD